MTDDRSDRDDPWAAPGDDLWAAAAGRTPPTPSPADLPPSVPEPTEALPSVPPGSTPPGDGPPTPGAPPPSGGRPAWLLPLVLGVAAVLAVVALVVLLTRDGPAEVTEDSSPPVSPATTVPGTTVPVTVAPSTVAPTTTAAPTTTSTTEPATTTTVPSLPAGLTLTQAAGDGVHSLSGADDVLVAAERVELALAVGDGSFLVQNRSGRTAAFGETLPADTEIRRIGAVSEVLVPAATDQWHTLHDVEVVDGRRLVLVSTVQGSNIEDWREDLYLIDLDTGERTDLGVVATWESGTSRLHLSADGLIVGEWYASVVSGPLFMDLDGNEGLDPASVGLEAEYVDCGDCPRAFSVSSDGARLAWIQGGTLVLYDRQAGARLAEVPLGGSAEVIVDSIEVGSDAVVLNVVDSPGGQALAPVVVGFDGTITPLARRGVATID